MRSCSSTYNIYTSTYVDPHHSMSRKGLWKRTFRLGHCLGGKPAGILIKSLLWRTSPRKPPRRMLQKLSPPLLGLMQPMYLSHLNATSNSPKMVDVTHKVPMRRKAMHSAKSCFLRLVNKTTPLNILPSITLPTPSFILQCLRSYESIRKSKIPLRHGTKEAYEWRSAKVQ